MKNYLKLFGTNLSMFHEDHREWFLFSFRTIMLFVFTIMGLDFMRAWAYGKMDSLLFVALTPVDFNNPVGFWGLFIETMAVGYFWIKQITRIGNQIFEVVKNKW